MMAGRVLRTLAGLCVSMCSAQAADFVPEQVTVDPLPPPSPTRMYVQDVALSHIVDGRLHIVDGATMRYEGMLGTGLTGLVALAPDRREIYVATSYLSRLNRGTRTDTVDVYDSQTLTLKEEIVIPPKHAQALPYKGVMGVTGDGRFILVQNATPASSIAVVDRKASKPVAEVPTPGCWGIPPRKHQRAAVHHRLRRRHPADPHARRGGSGGR